MSETAEEISKDGYSGLSVMGEIVFSIGSNGRITKFNEESEKLSGYSKYDAIGKVFIDFLVPDRYSDRWKDVFDTVKKNKLIDDFNLPLLTKNGHEIMISWSSFPVKDDMGVVRDITFVGKLISSWDDAKEPPVSRASDADRNIGEYDDVYKIFKELEKRNEALEKANKELEEKIKKLKKKKTSRSGVFSGFLVGKSKKEEIENELNEIEKRKHLLDELEVKLNEEKRSLNEQRKWFVKWREKLESLEYEIENRRQNLANLNRLADEQVLEADTPVDIGSKDVFDVGYLDDISDGAAIIQRGILRKVNDYFAELLGYGAEEIVDKSLFDFISPEGFSGLEDYYLHRLKGDSVSSYDTIFLTKDNSKVFVEVETKPIVFDGEKAELAVFRKIKDKKD